ncbi:DUF58 domain-containing protein [bacterium]|nr:DUF58 domain-containing protein [bacterium]
MWNARSQHADATHPSLPGLMQWLARGRTLSNQLRGTPIASLSMVGEAPSRRRGQGMIFDSVREYAHGDDIRRMDWKVTARTGRAHTKLYVEEQQRLVVLLIDATAPMRFGTRVQFKHVLAGNMAALAAGLALGRGSLVGGLILTDQGGIAIPPTHGPKAAYRILQALSEGNMKPSINMPGNLSAQCQAILTLPWLRQVHARILWWSDFHQHQEKDADNLQQQLAILARRHRPVLLAIDDPADQQLPPLSALPLEDASGRRVKLNTESQKLQHSYSQIWKDRRASLQRIAQLCGVPLMATSTTTELGTTPMLWRKLGEWL